MEIFCHKYNVDMFKEYLYQLQKLSLGDVYLKLHCEVTKKLKHYITLLCDVKFQDGAYHEYYGDIKTIVNSFITCWTKTIDEASKVVDKYTHIVNYDELINLVDTTIMLNEKKQIEFARDFLPVRSQLEQERYEEIEGLHKNFMRQIYTLRDQVEKLDKQEKIDNFAKEHFPLSLEKKNNVFLFTHTYMSILLIDHVERIRVSLEEIELRTRNCLQALKDKRDTSVSCLLNQLYEKNKEHLCIFRQDSHSSIEIAEVKHSMEVIKDKIAESNHMPMSRMIEEHKYWQERMVEFNHIADTIKKLNKVEKKLIEQEKILNSNQCLETHDPNSRCWGETVQTLKANLEVIKDMRKKTAMALMTFFCVKGPDHVIHSDYVGPYYVDDFGHKVYFFDYGLNEFHINCEGNFVKVNENEKYFYDHLGRYVIDTDGRKLYQIGPCTSTYNLRNDIFEKHTKDCGHSNREVKGCRMRLKDPNDVSVLPITEAVDLSESLDSETSKYLWESFGHILPFALRDVAVAQPKNPIHYLAHMLLFHKYSRSQSELRALKKEADKSRAKLFQDRKDKAITSSKAWKAKQVKRRKPEESDDTLERFAYDTHLARQDFIRYLNGLGDYI